MGNDAARPAGRRPDRSAARVLFYSGGGGLGGIRRVLAVAWELARRAPDTTLLALHDCPRIRLFPVPATFDDVQLPPSTEADLFPEPAARPGGAASPASARPVPARLRQAIATATARAYAPQLVLVDRLPAGADGELGDALWLLDAARPRPVIALGLPDVPGDPATVRRRWRAEGAVELLERVYDRILVYGDGRILDPVAEYGLSQAVAAKIAFCGYLVPDPPAEPPSAVRTRLGVGDAPLLVCDLGGEADGAPLTRSLFAALRRPELAGAHAVVVAGPLPAPGEPASTIEVASGQPNVKRGAFVPDFTAYLNAADVVLTTGGANTVAETIRLGKRPIVVPGVDPWGERLVRARRLAALGTASWLAPDDATPVQLARAIRAALDDATSPPPVLDFDGLRRTGDVLVDALSGMTARRRHLLGLANRGGRRPKRAPDEHGDDQSARAGT